MRPTRRARALLWLTITAVAMVRGGPLPAGPRIGVAVDGRHVWVAAGSTAGQTLRRLGVRPAAGDLLAADHTVLRPRAYPLRVLVNGRPAAWERRLHPGDRVTVEGGRDRLEPVVRVVRRLPASVPGNPARSLATGPVRAVLLRGRLSGRVAPVAFRSAASPPAPLPVALTFDDGPWPGTTERVLAVLARLRAPATFFVVGRQVERHPALVRGELTAGMAVGTHSYSHPQPFGRLPAARIRDEIARGRRTLDRLGVRPVGFRPPGGAASPAAVAAARSLGYRTVLWDVDPDDWQPGVTPDQIVARVLSAARPGAVVLLHDGGGDRSATVAALPAIIDGLRRLGFTLTVLPP
ncbi:MAG TPA: polysaccharide deacetylase family protein [Actinomycetes bacterium]|jgi:peptidoglycan/xylan/chitin deacetylase (PgdA/CDA1 family)|nr:polysaccharide deacetylase family protein [Actinomycetes bacterium]